ncbi:MAG: tyrosine-type recombinase/integrase [Acidobacteria bacterium]|nr:tyrosine-type recombinase/integrase [Acidobacteriota bacterium]
MPTLLTAAFVATVRVDRRTTFADALARGLVLRVTPTGAKSWAFVYRVKGGGKVRWLALGPTDVLSLAKAREVATGHRYAVQVERRDPVAERQTAAAPAPAVFTFQDLADLYAQFAKGRKRTWREDVRKIRKYLTPAWGALPLRAITRTHVHERLDQLVAQGMTIGVNRIQAVISRMFTLALDRSLIDSHPAARMIKRFDERAGERVLTDAEIRALWAGLDAHPGPAADVIRLRLLLGQRGGETAGMAWLELDLEAGIWAIPGRRTKNGHPHAVPLPATALALLTRRRTEVSADEPRVFSGPARSEIRQALSALTGSAYTWTDLRRTVATRLAELGHDETIIGRVLNHAKHSVTMRHYNKHQYLDEKRRALEDWDRALQRLLTQVHRGT